MPSKNLLIITGPTAVGKTSMAITLAQHFSSEIINADSRQVYREMRIGTAVPSQEQLAQVKHHCVMHRSIHDYYNAGLYELEVIELLSGLFSKSDVVIMAGGSGLYIDAVCRGIDQFPSVDPSLRLMLRMQFEQEGLAGIQQRLREADPDYYDKVDRSNPNRILKALEICMMTGRPYSSFLTGKTKKRDFRTIRLGIDMDRDALHSRINHRVDAMLQQGLLDEARNLFPFRHLNALNTVGYKELFSYFLNHLTLQKAVDSIKGHTRQYARRQLTWFRRDREMQWFQPGDTQDILSYIYDKIEE